MPHFRVLTCCAAWLLSASVSARVFAQDVTGIESGRINVGSTLTRVVLNGTFTAPVVVCTVNRTHNTAPVVTRVSAVTPHSFDVRLQNPSNGAVVADWVSYLVVESGSWSVDGVAVDAWTYTSTLTDHDGMWAGRMHNYLQSHDDPVVLGQVMTSNDADWSVFWCQGALLADAPTALNLRTGKMVGEDTRRTRANETIGIIAIGTASGTLGGVAFEARVGPDTVLGIGGAAPVPYTFAAPFDSAPQIVLATMAGIDGGVGGWAQSHGTTPTQVFLSIDEDQLQDDERTHTSEQVGYVAFEHGFNLAIASGSACTVDADCEDAIACTIDRCIAGICEQVTLDELCDNGQYCDGVEYCATVTGCMPGTPPCSGGCNETTDQCAGCITDDDCRDGLYCTGVESCVGGACVAGTPPCASGFCLEPHDTCGYCYGSDDCDDDLFCNGPEICYYGACWSLDPPCAGLCDEDINSCVTCLSDADCDDGVFCNGAEMCDAGTCQAGTPPDCSDAHPCTVDSCSEALAACVNTPSDISCDNGAFCDGHETCDPLFGCVPGTAPCPTQCSEPLDTCVECTTDAECSDDLFCNGAEQCQNGLCVAGVAPTCNDGVACTLDMCNEAAAACSHTVDHLLCSNGLFCDGLETCDRALGCIPGAIPCTGACDDFLDACVECLADDDCDDRQPCNGIEHCIAGVCVTGTAIACDDGLACTHDACDETTGLCAFTPHDDLCDNGLFCDGSETCDVQLGCLEGVPPCALLCNDDTDTCTECSGSADCNDGLFCNGEETCVDGACVVGPQPDCTDGVACTVDTCDEDSMACLHTPNSSACSDGAFCNGPETCHPVDGCIAGPAPCPGLCNNTLAACVECITDDHCEDGLVCNGTATCAAGVCIPGAPPICDDGITCTVDLCDETTRGCQFTPDDTLCDNGLFCDGSEQCDHMNDCVPGVPPCSAACDDTANLCVECLDNSGCDDGLFCNGAETCAAGVCIAGLPIDCSDAIACTTDTCNEDLNACVHTPNHTMCDNDLYCDGSESCNPSSGCVPGMAPCPTTCEEATDACLECLVSADCNDNVVCNGIEACIAGQCVAGNAPACDDGIACTTDLCDEEAGGCIHQPVDAMCNNNLFCDGNETCDAEGGCLAGPAPCTELCNETIDACVTCLLDAHCTDGLFCNGAERCTAGDCVPGDMPNCDDGLACSDDWCNEQLDECQHQLMHASCDDGLYCNGVELCSPEGCVVGTPPCAVLCDESLDTCVECVTNADCVDGLQCNGLETCSAGTCTPGTAPDCDDGVACTSDSCLEPGGCIHLVQHQVCDNGVFCDGRESCDPTAGCVAGAPPCSGTCDEDTATCTGCGADSDCDDGLFCTGTEVCQDGTCVPGSPPCPSFCLEGLNTCGACQIDAHCDDGIECTGIEQCYFGTCFQFDADPCDDGIACTIDRCDVRLGSCVFDPAHERCDNGQFCDGAELCSSTLGCQSTAPPCSGFCDEATDACSAMCETAADCDDGLYCNGIESCVAGDCVPGTAPLCDDGIACTQDMCDEPLRMCVAIPEHDRCDNGLFCDGSEVCSIGTGCTAGTAPCPGTCLEDFETCAECTGDSDCDDQLFCNGTEICLGGLCDNTLPPCTADEVCDEDTDQCTATTTAGSVINLTLIDAENNQPIPAYDPLFDGAVINIDALPPLSVTANVMQPIGSITFEILQNGALIYSHTENVGPYALFGDDPVGNYASWPGAGPDSGQLYDIRATPYADANGAGTAGSPVSVSFLTAGGCQSDSACNDGLFCNGAETCNAGTCLPGSQPCPGLACHEATQQCAAAQGVISLALIDAESDQVIPAHTPLVSGETLNSGALPPVAIQAVTVPTVVGSVKFQMRRNGVLEWQRTENTAPYALFGDTSGDFDAWPANGPQVGSTYEITATSYSGNNGGGAADPPLTVVLHFTDACATDSDCSDGLYCTGVESCVDGTCVAGPVPCADGLVCNESTNRCTTPVAQTLYVDDDGASAPGYDPSAPLGSFNHPFASAQAAADAAIAGDTVLFRTGTYTSGSTAQAATVMSITTSGQPGLPITFAAAPGEQVVFSGQNGVSNTLLDIHAAFIDIAGLELTGARRAALQINGGDSHDINIRLCHAHHNDHDGNWIGAAFRTNGPASHILFEECISHDNAGGFQLRESPTQTSGTAAVPPRAGNTGFANDLPEAQWSAWPGWTAIAARHVTWRRCIAYNNMLIDEHSDGFGLRYGIECIMEDCIGFRNSDEGADLLGATRCIARRNIMFDNDPDNTPNGDGNGIKIGVRGGLDCLAYGNIVFDNPRGGIDMADTERPVVFNNTVFNNDVWFGIWFEGGRSQTGATIFNNICANHTKGDIGFNGGVALALANHNLMTGPNTHNWARPAGSASLINTNPQFLNQGLTVNTSFPTGLSIAGKLAFIRNQVHAKLGLSTTSPAIDAGMAPPGSELPFNGAAHDMGAIESE